MVVETMVGAAELVMKVAKENAQYVMLFYFEISNPSCFLLPLLSFPNWVGIYISFACHNTRYWPYSPFRSSRSRLRTAVTPISEKTSFHLAYCWLFRCFL